MGYYISTPDTHFSIRTSDLPKFFDLVSHLMADDMVSAHGRGGSYDGGKKTESWYAWVNTKAVLEAVAKQDISAVFNEWGYELDFVHEIDGISYYRLDIRQGNAKIGDEEKFFAAIAPAVADGSFLYVEGEDGAEWRWMWENGKFYSQDVLDKEVVFDDPREIDFSA